MKAQFFKFYFLLLAIFVCSCTSSTQDFLEIDVNVSHPKFADSDPFEWEGRKPWDYPIHGIDVAKYQGKINWQKVIRSGIAFAFIKATEGGDHLDERFRENWAEAKRSGVLRGAYHFYYFCRPATEQARWFIRHVPKERGALPPVLDVEWNHTSPTCRKRPDADTVRAEMEKYLRRVASHYGKRPLIYTTVDFYKINQLWRIKGYDYWLRSVAGHPSSTYPGQSWTFWQYTGTGIVPGIDGNTDINVFFGSPSQWNKWVMNSSKG